jgi:hypothetical protein
MLNLEAENQKFITSVDNATKSAVRSTLDAIECAFRAEKDEIPQEVLNRLYGRVNSFVKDRVNRFADVIKRDCGELVIKMGDTISEATK